MGRKYLNYCEFVKKHKGNTIFESVFHNFVKFSNVPKEGCPIPPAKYTFNGVIIDISKIPSIFPSGTYLGYINMLTLNEKKIKISIIQVSAEVKLVNGL